MTSDNIETIKQWAEECLSKGLYIEGRLAKTYFQKPKSIIKMSYEEYGWAALFDCAWSSTPLLGVYVKDSHRGKDLGKGLIEDLVKDYSGSCTVFPRSYFENLDCLKGKLCV